MHYSGRFAANFTSWESDKLLPMAAANPRKGKFESPVLVLF